MDTVTEHDDVSHARLSPSAAHRWITCPASLQMEEQHPDDRTSDYAAEGSFAHLWASDVVLPKLLRRRKPGEQSKIRYSVRHSAAGSRWWSPELDDYVARYAALVVDERDQLSSRDLPASVELETRVSIDELVPGCWGTADAVVLSGDGKMLSVMDLKYGRGVKIDAPGNPQLMIYGLGALLSWSPIYEVATVRMTIVQPRLDHVSVYEIDAMALMDWGRTVLVPAARAALSGDPADRPFVPGEVQCRFCAAAGLCDARAQSVLDEDFDELPEAMTPGRLGDVLGRVPQIEAWCKAVRQHATGAARGGTEIPGWKLVEGRSHRKIVDPHGALVRLRSAGFADEQVLRDPELRTLTELLRLDKHITDVLGPTLVKPAGALTLVPADDPRPPVGSVESAAADFD